MKTTTWLLIGGAIAAVVVIGVAAGGLTSGVPVDVTEVKRGPIREFVDERGKTRLPETYLITMPINGRIEAITLTEGDEVREGDEVARIVPRDLDLTVEEATAAVERLEEAIRENAYSAVEETALKQAEQFVKSMLDTVKVAATRVSSGKDKFDYQEKHFGRISASKQAHSEEELDRALLDKLEAGWNLRQDELVLSATESLAAATNLMPSMVSQFIERKSYTEAVLKKQLAEATARLRQVQQDQERGTMTSPATGVVLDRPVTNERFLPAGTKLLEIGRLEDLEIEADVLSVDVVTAKPGDAVEIYGPAIGRGLPDGKDYADGKVHKIFPAGFTKISSLGVEQQRVKVIIRLDPDDLDWLRSERELGVGYRVRVRIQTDEKADALVVPRSALFRGMSGGWNVYAVRDGRARIQEVEIGMINDESAEVTAGLEPGDQVVRAPESNLTDGQRVKVASE
jgi:HlyD family secretion protein